MKSRWRIVLIGVFTIGLWTATASGQYMYGSGSGFGGSHMMFPLFVKGVSLTDAQQAQVKQIVATHQPQFQTLLGQLRAAHDQLSARLYAPGPAKAEDLAPLVQQIGQLRGQLTQEALQVALEIRGVLTPEQLAKAGQMRTRMNELRTEMRNLLGRDH